MKKFGVILVMAALVLVPVQVSALTLSELVELFIALDLIAEDKVDAARALVAGEGVGVSTCEVFEHNLRVGSTDATSNGEVTKLQQYLTTTGDYTFGKITGFYGRITEEAVQNWQRRNGVVSSGTPNTTGFGVFGPKTRQAVESSCVNETEEVAQEEVVEVAEPENTTDEIVTTPEEVEEVVEVPEVVSLVNTHSIDLEQESGQFLSILDSDQIGLDVAGDLTIEAWVNAESIREPGCNSCNKLHSFVDKTNADDFAYSFYWRENKGETLLLSSAEKGTTDLIDVEYSFDTDRWFHFAATFDSQTGTVNLYRNGFPLGSGIVSSGFGTAITNASAAFYIGARQGTLDFLDGKIDEVRIWSIERSASDISENYKKELTGTEGGLVGYWKFNNELVDGKAKDSSQNGNHLELHNGPVFSSDKPF